MLTLLPQIPVNTKKCLCIPLLVEAEAEVFSGSRSDRSGWFASGKSTGGLFRNNFDIRNGCR